MGGTEHREKPTEIMERNNISDRQVTQNNAGTSKAVARPQNFLIKVQEQLSQQQQEITEVMK